MVVFQDQKQLPGDKLRVHIVQGWKNVHNWRKLFFLINHVRKFWKGHDRNVKGALDNFSLIPPFFSKKVEIFIPLEVYTYVVTACLILLATST